MNSTGFYIIKNKVKTPIILGKKIGSGGEGTVYSIEGNQMVAKIYDKKEEQENQEYYSRLAPKITRLRSLLKFAPQDKETKLRWICKPQYTVFNDKGQAIGYTMIRARGNTLFEILTPQTLKKILKWTCFDLCQVALAILDLFDTLHDAGILMADVNLNNIMADIDKKNNNCRVWFIDVDSYQVGGFDNWKKEFPCLVGRMEFVSDRLLNSNFGSGKIYRNLEDELYAIATLLFSIFIPGAFPWERQDVGHLERLNKERVFSFPDGYRDNGKVHAGVEMLWYRLPQEMRSAFCNAFMLKQYPATDVWRMLILSYQEMLKNGQKKNVIFPPNDIPLVKRVRELDPQPYSVKELEKGRGWNHLCVWNNDKTFHMPMAIEIGASGIKLKLLQASFRGAAPERMSVRSKTFAMPFFSLLKGSGTLSVSGLRDVLNSPKAQEMREALKKAMQQRPPYTDLHAYGLSFLRNLSNRSEVTEILEKISGYEFKVYTAEEEAKFHMKALGDDKGSPRLLMHLSSSSLVLALDIPGKNLIVEEDTSLGKELIFNWFMDTHLPRADLSTSLLEHDSDIEAYVKPLVGGIKHQLIISQTTAPLKIILLGYNIQKYLAKGSENIDIETICSQLDNTVKLNRNNVGNLEAEIHDSRGANIKNQVLLRLSLPAVRFLWRQFPDSALELYNQQANLTKIIIKEHFDH